MTPPSAPYAGELGPPVEPGSDLVAVGPCGLCGRPFAFDPATVPAMRLDPDTGLPPDVGGTDAAAAVAHPLCEGCVAAVEAARAKLGLPRGWPRATPW